MTGLGFTVQPPLPTAHCEANRDVQGGARAGRNRDGTLIGLSGGQAVELAKTVSVVLRSRTDGR